MSGTLPADHNTKKKSNWLWRYFSEEHFSELVRGASVALVLRGVGTLLQFAFNVLLARLLGAHGAGVYYLAFMITTAATVIGRLGLDNSVLRFIAACVAVDDWAGVRGVYTKGLALAIGASTVFSVFVFFSAESLFSNFFREPELATTLRVFAFAVVPFAVFTLHAQALQALKKIALSTAVSSVAVPVVAVSLLTYYGDSLGISGAAIAYVTGTILAAILGLVFWMRSVPSSWTVAGSFTYAKLLRSSFPLLWVASINLIMSWTSTFFLGFFRTSVEVGIYNLAARTAFLTALVLLAVNSIVAPKLAALHEKGDSAGLRDVVTTSSRMMMLAVLPILIVYVAAPKLVMSVFGAEFTAGGLALVILAIGQFINVSTGSVGYLLMMTGNEKALRDCVTLAGVVAVLGNAGLTPLFGVQGSAIATAVGLATLNVAAAYIAWKRLAIWTAPIGRRLAERTRYGPST